MFQVSLIVAGDRAKENLILPKYTSPVINKYIRPLCNPYLELVNAFYTNNMSELQVRFYKFKSYVCGLWIWENTILYKSLRSLRVASACLSTDLIRNVGSKSEKVQDP